MGFIEYIVDFIVMCLFVAAIITGLFLFFKPIMYGYGGY